MPRSQDDYFLKPPPDTSPASMHAALQRSGVLNDNSKKWVKRYRTEISASSASLLSTFIAYPLDSVKTRMQAYKFPNFSDCVRHTYKTEGVHGFWRGVPAPLASITIVRTVSFSIYQRAKYTYDDWIMKATGTSPLVHANTRGAKPSAGTVMCFGAAGATSGALITVLSCPFELTKLSSQIAVLLEKGVDKSGYEKGAKESAPATNQQTPQKTRNTFATAKMIIKHRGVLGLYSGFHLHLLRDTIGTGIYFMTYESSKQLLANARGNSPSSPLAVVTAGGLCGLVSWACIYPIDSAKSIYQRNILRGTNTGQQNLDSSIASSEATSSKEASSSTSSTKKNAPAIQFFSRRMYRGLGVSMARSCVVNAMFFSVFELIKKQINHLEFES